MDVLLHMTLNELTHWGRETHICVGKLTIIASDNGLSPGRRQAIIWTNARILLIGPLGTNFNEILIEIYIFSFKKMHLKMSSAKWRPFCLGPNVLNYGYDWLSRPKSQLISVSNRELCSHPSIRDIRYESDDNQWIVPPQTCLYCFVFLFMVISITGEQSRGRYMTCAHLGGTYLRPPPAFIPD